MKHIYGPRLPSASPGRVSASPLTRKDDPKLARRAGSDSDDASPDMSQKLPARRDGRRRADLSADGWTEGIDRLWRKSFPDVERMPGCEVGYVTHAAVRDGSSGVIIRDPAGSKNLACMKRPDELTGEISKAPLLERIQVRQGYSSPSVKDEELEKVFEKSEEP